MTDGPKTGESFLEPDEERRPADEPALDEEPEASEGASGEKPDVPPGSGLRPTAPG